MKRNEVIQVRVSPDEKTEYEALAKALGMNVSEWVRSLASRQKDELHPREPIPSDPFGLPAATERAVGFKRLVAQIQGKKSCSPKEAEEEARKRLGME